MPGVMDTARATSPRKACEKSREETTSGVADTTRTTSPRNACEKSRTDHAGRDGYHENNEPTPDV